MMMFHLHLFWHNLGILVKHILGLFAITKTGKHLTKSSFLLEMSIKVLKLPNCHLLSHYCGLVKSLD